MNSIRDKKFDYLKITNENCNEDNDCSKGLKCVQNKCTDSNFGSTCNKNIKCNKNLNCVRNICKGIKKWQKIIPKKSFKQNNTLKKFDQIESKCSSSFIDCCKQKCKGDCDGIILEKNKSNNSCKLFTIKDINNVNLIKAKNNVNLHLRISDRNFKKL